MVSYRKDYLLKAFTWGKTSLLTTENPIVYGISLHKVDDSLIVKVTQAPFIDKMGSGRRNQGSWANAANKSEMGTVALIASPDHTGRQG